jgi:hypothetical protein
VTLTDHADNATITAFAGGVNDEWGSRVYAFRRSIPVATVNSTVGGVVLPAIGAKVDPGFAYRILDVKLLVNGTAAGATSIDVTHTPNGFPESSFIWTIAGGSLVDGNYATPDSISSGGAAFKVGYNGYGIGVKKVGSDITGISTVDVIVQYTIENGWIT